jgi:hypothetical protein
MNKTLVQSILSGLIGSASCLAGAAELPATAKFESGPTVEAVGHAVFLNSIGSFRYGTASDGRIRSQPFVIGTAPRDDYQLFSWQEEEALWYVLQEQLNENEITEPKKTRKIRATFKARIDWPRVIVKGRSTVCVPDLPKANQDDWRDHLLCTDVKGALE